MEVKQPFHAQKSGNRTGEVQHGKAMELALDYYIPIIASTKRRLKSLRKPKQGLSWPIAFGGEQGRLAMQAQSTVEG